MSNDSGVAAIDWGSASKPYFTATGFMTTGLYFYCSEKLVGATFHARLKTDGTAPVRVVSVKYGTAGANSSCDETSDGYFGAEWGEIWGKDTSAGSYYGGRYGTRSDSQGTKSIYVQRVWID